MDEIKIRGLEISACHGVNDFEKVTEQCFIIDADIKTRFYNSAKTDNISDTVNYSSACSLITEVVKGNVFNLIEKLAYECAFSLMEKFAVIQALSLTVWKPEAPMKRKFEKVGASVNLERETAYLSLGSSMGDRKAILDGAIKKLNAVRGIEVKKVSDYLETAPYGGVAQNKFINCAVQVSTILDPFALLDEIHLIEAEFGRVRDKHWGDRTLDIDIIFFGDKHIFTENLIIPHPDYANRDFVKIPLKQIAPCLIK